MVQDKEKEQEEEEEECKVAGGCKSRALSSNMDYQRALMRSFAVFPEIYSLPSP